MARRPFFHAAKSTEFRDCVQKHGGRRDNCVAQLGLEKSVWLEQRALGGGRGDGAGAGWGQIMEGLD